MMMMMFEVGDLVVVHDSDEPNVHHTGVRTYSYIIEENVTLWRWGTGDLSRDRVKFGMYLGNTTNWNIDGQFIVKTYKIFVDDQIRDVYRKCVSTSEEFFQRIEVE